MSDGNKVTKVQLSLFAQRLPNVAGAFKGTSDPYAIVTVLARDPRDKPRILGKTEVIKNGLSPYWTTTFTLDYEFGKPTRVSIEIFDEVRKAKTNKPMGSVIFEIGECLESRGGIKAKKLKQGGTVFARVIKAPKQHAGTFDFTLRGIKLKNVEKFSKSDPFFEVSRLIQAAGGPSWQPVYRSKQVMNDLNPKWDPASVDINQLCGGDLDKAIRISAWDWEKSGKHTPMGSFETTVNAMVRAVAPDGGGDAKNVDTKKTFKLKLRGKDFGSIVVVAASIQGGSSQAAATQSTDAPFSTTIGTPSEQAQMPAPAAAAAAAAAARRPFNPSDDRQLPRERQPQAPRKRAAIMPLFRRNRNSNVNNNHESSPAEFARQSQELIPAEVRMISGCHSEQTSADVGNVGAVAQLPNPAGKAGGACTSALLEILYRQRNQPLTFQQVLLDLRASLQSSGFDQIPQLTSSRPLDVQDTPFSLVGGNGIRRAVLVGINYRGQNGELSGCHNDVFNVKKYIMTQFGYQEQNILVLVDDGRHHYPNRANIVNSLRNLVAQSQSGDSVYFHYSGHGGLLNADWNVFKSNNKDYDETIYPLDHVRRGHIRDFTLFNDFVKPMAAGVTVTCVIDACHSGAVLELPYSYQPTDGGTIRMQRNMSSLSNLAFLYILAGGMLPHGFGNVAENIEDTTGGNLEDYQGMGMDDTDVVQDGGYGDVPQDGGDVADADGYGDAGDAPGYDGDPGEPVQGYDVPDDGPRGFGDDSGAGFDGGGGEQAWGAAEDTGGGWGDGGGMGGGGWEDAGDGGDVDCSCLGDILGALLDGE